MYLSLDRMCWDIEPLLVITLLCQQEIQLFFKH